jgi:dTDP-4-dehydrorhamnose 3,5-epimerase-like enzyme
MELCDGLRVIRLTDTGDVRGSSFQSPPGCLDFLGAVRDIHTATINPGSVRGNHYHELRREVLCIFYTDQWSLHWDCGPDTEIRREAFSGSGAVMVEIEPQASHAVRNDGKSEIQMVGLSSVPFDPEEPDSFRRQVV